MEQTIRCIGAVQNQIRALNEQSDKLAAQLKPQSTSA
jgi:hypothetical protein